MSGTQPRSEMRYFMACAEPSWGAAVTPPQLVGLLNLAALLGPTIYFSDVHLGDNTAFLSTYRSGDAYSLYTQVRALAERGIVRLLLRDASIRTGSRLEIESFRDVYRAWQVQDSSASWVTPDAGPERERYFRHLDDWALDTAVDRYAYDEVKRRFMRNVRASYETGDGGWLLAQLTQLDRDARGRYAAILRQDWFSWADLYALFKESGVARDDELVLYHGLLNEAAYTEALDASMLGVDPPRTYLEERFWTTPAQGQGVPAATVDGIMAEADAQLSAPSLAVLGLLTADEITAARARGAAYFDLMRMASTPHFDATSSDFAERLRRATIEYWGEVCDLLAAQHPGAARRPNRFGIFLGRLPGPFGRLGRAAVQLAFNVGTPVAELTLPPGVSVATEAARKGAEKHLSLRFLISTDTPEMKQIRRVIPDRSWATRTAPAVLLPAPTRPPLGP